MTKNFNCVFLETTKVEVIWFLHGTLQYNQMKYCTLSFVSGIIVVCYMLTWTGAREVEAQVQDSPRQIRGQL